MNDAQETLLQDSNGSVIKARYQEQCYPLSQVRKHMECLLRALTFGYLCWDFEFLIFGSGMDLGCRTEAWLCDIYTEVLWYLYRCMTWIFMLGFWVPNILPRYEFGISYWGLTLGFTEAWLWNFYTEALWHLYRRILCYLCWGLSSEYSAEVWIWGVVLRLDFGISILRHYDIYIDVWLCYLCWGLSSEYSAEVWIWDIVLRLDFGIYWGMTLGFLYWGIMTFI
jgi:hypothetical protein